MEIFGLGVDRVRWEAYSGSSRWGEAPDTDLGDREMSVEGGGVAEALEPTEVEVEEMEEAAVDELPDPASRFEPAAGILLGKLEELVSTRNTEATWLTRNSRDALTVMDSIKESGEDEEVVATLEAIEKLNSRALELEQAMDKHLREKAQEIIEASQDEDEVKAHREAFAAADKRVRDFKRTLAGTYVVDDEGPTIEDYFPAEVKLSKSGKPSGTGPRRLRHFTIYVDGTEAKAKMGGEMKSSFGAGAQHLNTTLAHFTSRYFEVIGSSDKKDFRSAEFEYTHPETGKVSHVRAEYDPPAE